MKNIELEIIRCFLNSIMWPRISALRNRNLSSGSITRLFSSYWEYCKKDITYKKDTKQGNFVFCKYYDLAFSIEEIKFHLKAFDDLP